MPSVGISFPYGEVCGNGVLELGVIGFVHYAHASAAEFLRNPVMRYRLADHSGPHLLRRSTPKESHT